MNIRAIPLLLLLSVAATPATAELYRWTDADGRVHYSDRKPAAESEEEVEAIDDQLTPVNIDESHKQRQALNKVFAKEDKHVQRGEQQQQRKQQQARAQQCREARGYLRAISGPVAFLDEDGKDMKISERERQERQAEMERLIEQYCD